MSEAGHGARHETGHTAGYTAKHSPEHSPEHSPGHSPGPLAGPLAGPTAKLAAEHAAEHAFEQVTGQVTGQATGQAARNTAPGTSCIAPDGHTGKRAGRTDNETLAALRDFFAATGSADLRDAATRIAAATGFPLPAGTDWTAAEYLFNRLFVGPAAVPAPPYASAYGDDESLLMGKPAQDARQAYRSMGLAVPRQGTTPDDHLAFELDAVLALRTLAGASSSCPAEPHAAFITDHMACWLPRFIQAVRANLPSGTAGGVPGSPERTVCPVTLAVDTLAAWLDEETRSMAASSPHSQNTNSKEE